MKIIRKIAFTLSLAVLFSTFTACGNSSNKPASDDAAAYDTVSFPLKDPVTLTYWMPMNLDASKVMKSYNESIVFQQMEKLTNVKIQFIHPAIGQESEQFNLMIASGSCPDMIMTGVSNYVGGGEKALQDGVFLKLNDLAAKYMPNYTKLRNDNPEAKKETVTDSGDMVAVYPLMKQENLCWAGPSIRKDWLDETGMPVPQTLSDWDALLKAIKAKHPDSTPILFAKEGAPSFRVDGVDTYDTFLSAYGVGPSFYVDNGKVAYGPMQSGFKTYLQMMNGWYKAGLLDKDFPARDDSGITNLITSGKAAVYVGSVDSANQYFSAAKLAYVTAPYPTLKKGDKIEFRAKDWTATPTGSAVSISAQCKHPEVALAWLDYAYSEKGSMLYNFGVEGQTYTMQNGSPMFTDTVLHNSDVNATAAQYKFKFFVGPQLRWGAYSNASTITNPTVMEEKKEWTTNTGYGLMLPPTTMTSDEGKKYANIMNSIDTYRTEMTIKFIMGFEPLDKFDQYVAQLKTLKIDDALALQQAAYDRFEKR